MSIATPGRENVLDGQIPEKGRLRQPQRPVESISNVAAGPIEPANIGLVDGSLLDCSLPPTAHVPCRQVFPVVMLKYQHSKQPCS